MKAGITVTLELKSTENVKVLVRSFSLKQVEEIKYRCAEVQKVAVGLVEVHWRCWSVVIPGDWSGNHEIITSHLKCVNQKKLLV